MSDTLTPSGLQSSAGLYGSCGVYQFDRNGAIFNPLDLNPYLLFDAESSMIGTLENPTLDLDPTKQESLDVITATRAGTATYTDVNGLIASAPANTVRVDHVDGVPMILVEPSATNLVPYSADFSHGSWTKESGTVVIANTTETNSPTGSSDASKITSNGSKGLYYASGSSASLNTKSVFLKGVSGGEQVILKDPWGVVTQKTLTLTTEWVRYSLTETQSGNFGIWIDNIPANGIYMWGAQLETGSLTSYIPTSGSTVTRAKDDLSIDPDSTNHITNTDFSTWGTQNITVSSGGGFSGYSSSIITATGTGNKFFTATLSGVTAGQTHTGSIYIRRTNGSGRVDFVHPNSTSGSDSSNRTITTDWTRVTCQFNGSTSSGVVTQFQIRMFTAGDSLEIAMPQVELGSSPTGFIPTSGAASSRTAFSDFYNQSEGTVYVEFNPRELASANNTTLDFSNGTGTERILSLAYSSYHVYVVDGGVEQAHLDGGTYTVGAVNRLAFSYKANNIQASVGGGSVVTDTSASIPTVDRLQIGASYANAAQLNGHLKRLIFWPVSSERL